MKAMVPKKEMLATPAAIADVRPDWMTPNTKCPYFLGMRSIASSNQPERRRARSSPRQRVHLTLQGPYSYCWICCKLSCPRPLVKACRQTLSPKHRTYSQCRRGHNVRGCRRICCSTSLFGRTGQGLQTAVGLASESLKSRITRHRALGGVVSAGLLVVVSNGAARIAPNPGKGP